MTQVKFEPNQVWKDFQKWALKNQRDFVANIQSNLNYTVWYDLEDKEFFSTVDTGNIIRDFEHDTIKIFSNDNNSYWEPSISYKDYLGNYKLAYKRDHVSLYSLDFDSTNLDRQGFKNMLEHFDYNDTNINPAIKNFIDKNQTEFDTANLYIILDEAPESYFDNGLKDQQVMIIKGQLDDL